MRDVIIEDRVVKQRASVYVSGKTLISGSEQEVEQLNFADGKHLFCHFQPFKIFISNKAGMSYSCESSVLQGFNAYSCTVQKIYNIIDKFHHLPSNLFPASE